MAPRYDFTAFIRENQSLIFGNNRRDYSEKYRRNIAALDQKMNALLAGNNELTQDPKLILGLFALSIDQFGTFVKTDVTRYQKQFLDFLNNGGK